MASPLDGRWFKVSEVACLLGIRPESVRYLVKRGQDTAGAKGIPPSDVDTSGRAKITGERVAAMMPLYGRQVPATSDELDALLARDA